MVHELFGWDDEEEVGVECWMTVFGQVGMVSMAALLRSTLPLSPVSYSMLPLFINRLHPSYLVREKQEGGETKVRPYDVMVADPPPTKSVPHRLPFPS